jgi:farnesyl-diphosphate farnesyltransferase
MAATHELLKATARSFYLTLRVLPAGVSEQIGLAYLLARTTDTIADTELVAPAKRLEALRRLRQRILGQSATPLEFQDLADKQGAPAEKLLLEKAEESLAALQRLTAADRRLVAEVLDIITSGQELDLRRFSADADASPPGAPGKIIALQTAAELDDYTYRVAGCVGEFWTKLCRAHLYPQAKLDDAQMLADGARFGKGLQLVNILRDLPCDLKNGRCYLPLEELRPAGLTPENLLSPENEGVFLPLYRRHLDEAEAHLQAGWRYTNALPFGQFRVRLACAWPALLGLKTVQRLRAAGVAALAGRVKVPRPEVYRMMILSLLACPVPLLWRSLGGRTKAVASPGKL